MIWQFALPTVQRVVHVEQRLVLRDMWNDTSPPPKMEWEDENGNTLLLNMGIDVNWRVQRQLEEFGFTSPLRKPILDSYDLLTEFEYFHACVNDRWLFSRSRTSVEILAQTCRESRGVVKDNYELAFSNRFGPARTWFKFSSDVLYITCESHFCSVFSGRHEKSLLDLSCFDTADLQKIRHLALQFPLNRRHHQDDYLTKVAQSCGSLENIYLVRGDSSKDDGSGLALIDIEHASAGEQYSSPHWSTRRIEVYLRNQTEHKEQYTGLAVNEEDKMYIYKEDAEKNGEPTFEIPTVTFSSILSSDQCQKLAHLKCVLELLATYEDSKTNALDLIRDFAEPARPDSPDREFDIDEIHRLYYRADETINVLEAEVFDAYYADRLAAKWEEEHAWGPSIIEQEIEAFSLDPGAGEWHTRKYKKQEKEKLTQYFKTVYKHIKDDDFERAFYKFNSDKNWWEPMTNEEQWAEYGDDPFLIDEKNMLHQAFEEEQELRTRRKWTDLQRWLERHNDRPHTYWYDWNKKEAQKDFDIENYPDWFMLYIGRKYAS